ncbi:MAG: TetR/AcrR family transcriptional regulator [Tissierellia bacterium]|nr:TetR/AcrR family transcriptional regulator [Tissierellia bacterium]
MNDKFFQLTKEKQMRIINAGFEVFAKNDYKKASTEDIAVAAGISKGLLFYYFHNKKELYLFLYEYAVKVVTESVVRDDFNMITDFFELFDYSAKRKFELFQKLPYVSDFLMRAFFSQKEEISEAMNRKFENSSAGVFEDYFNNIDLQKFKEGINPVEILQMLTWLIDGYIHEKRRIKSSIDLEDLMEKYNRWSILFKEISYKEEYL